MAMGARNYPQGKKSMQKTFDNYMKPINEFDRTQYILP